MADIYDAAAAVRKLRETAERLRGNAVRELETSELPVSRRIRTGTQEPSENWMADELQAWLRAGRSEAEFAAAFAPEPEEPELTLLRRLRTGV